MNRKIVSIYLKMVMTAIVATLVIGVLVSYFLLFGKNSTDHNSPKNLATIAGAYVEINDESVEVDKEFQKLLYKGNVWLQVLDNEGNCIYEYNVPEDVPRNYSIFELTAYCMKSDELEGYTMFYLSLDDYDKYGVITGCDSDSVKKISYISDKTVDNDWLSSVLVFLITAIIIVVISSFVFSRKISRPVTDIIENINEITYGEYVEKEHKGNLFKDVFIKLKKLDCILKQNEKMREEWIANISHDLKTPLSTIHGYTEIIQNSEYESTREEVNMYASEIKKAEENMLDLIEDLKMSQKLKEGNVALNKEDSDIVEIINQCIKEVDSGILGNSNIIFNNNEEIVVNCDRALMKRCLQNIICNAFIHNKSNIVLRIGIEKKGKNVEIVIQDNGKGMSENDRIHIFERYYRGTNSQNTKGTGLGLAIANEIIITHGGSIKVESEIDKGTIFKIIL